MQWYKLLEGDDQKKIEAFYKVIPELKNIEIYHIDLEAYGRGISFSCYIPFPDKEISKWKENQYNTAGTILKFSGTHDISFTGTFGPDAVNTSINIEVLEKELLLVKIVNDQYKITFKCFYFSLGKIQGYNIEKE